MLLVNLIETKINTMKKILLMMLICGGVLSASAQDSTNSTTNDNMSTTTSPSTTTHKYYYYPSSNVYFDEASGNYWYKDNGANDWTEVQTLPATIMVDNTARVPLEYTGDEPWKNNASDIKRYKVKGNGSVKMKTQKKD